MATQLDLTQSTDILGAVLFVLLTIALVFGGTHRKIWSVQGGVLAKVYTNDLVLLAAVPPTACIAIYYVARSLNIPFLEEPSLARLLWFRVNLILLVLLLSIYFFNGRLARGLGALVTKWKVLQSSLSSLSASPRLLWLFSAPTATSTTPKPKSSSPSSKNLSE